LLSRYESWSDLMKVLNAKTMLLLMMLLPMPLPLLPLLLLQQIV
jgi:hypothetical protein